MSLFATLRRRAAGPETDASPSDTHAVAIEGYDRLAGSKVTARLTQLSQKDLEAVETYERAHRGRPAVLDKLRYLRTAQPLEGYDTLTDEQMPAALADADMATVQRVRSYERKLRRREGVLAEVERVRRQLRHPGNDHAAAARDKQPV